MQINGRKIGKNEAPYIIAEISANHNGSIERAKKTIEEAKKCKVDAVKMQTYTADTMTIECTNQDFRIDGGLWNGYYLYDLYKEAETPYEWHKELFEYAEKIGITLFSTPFDETAVDLLENINTPAYKIASFEITDLPLIKRVAKTDKPLLMSTGMASMAEIGEAVECAKSSGCESLLLFHCISAYPTPIEQANLLAIRQLRDQFKCEVGLSDHSIGITAPITAVAIGASAIEKHFTINKKEKSPDSEFSIEPEEMKFMVEATYKTWKSLGNGEIKTEQCETQNLQFRRSIYFTKNHKKGEVINADSVKIIRPGYGMAPKTIESIIGKKTKIAVKIGDRVTEDVLENAKHESNK